MSGAHSTSSHVKFPVTIDPIDFEDCDEDDVDFQSGVILYNFGIAYDCLAATAEHNPGASFKKLLQVKSYRIFQMTRSLLSKLSQNDGDDTPNFCTMTKHLLLKTLLTHNLIQASIQLDLQFESQEHRETMKDLLLFMEDQQRMLKILERGVAEAA